MLFLSPLLFRSIFIESDAKPLDLTEGEDEAIRYRKCGSAEEVAGETADEDSLHSQHDTSFLRTSHDIS
ncbi:hypothetical protein Bca4012_039122 [Brassica carinata]